MGRKKVTQVSLANNWAHIEDLVVTHHEPVEVVCEDGRHMLFLSADQYDATVKSVEKCRAAIAALNTALNGEEK